MTDNADVTAVNIACDDDMDTATVDAFTVINRFDGSAEHCGFFNVLLVAVAAAVVVFVVDNDDDDVAVAVVVIVVVVVF